VLGRLALVLGYDPMLWLLGISTFALSWLVLLPVVIASIYVAYRDIYGDA